MAKQVIQLGTPPTGVGGDTPPSANVKINSNFDELYAADLINYKRTNIIGTVSQSGGVPTGAIIETGTNANGTYTKFAGGAMICTRQVQVTVAIQTVSTSGVYYSGGNAAVAMPATFTSLMFADVGITSSSETTGWVDGRGVDSLSAWAGNILFDVYSRAAQAYTLQYFAIGRWHQ
ncbi:hypothetical protein [Pseudomonas sp. S1Bt23]|uniref:hypothetical protein n=1 Tax=Pseudomonas sp. S1Bt23 TaxID=3095074 RepID=UPI002A5AE4C4|nr:hypothetical protein [Pseudomonas sp. S1Bt23]WPO49539.1 hypothetical protein SHB59_10925 [Pseudomonas sp. S1Bt23]